MLSVGFIQGIVQDNSSPTKVLQGATVALYTTGGTLVTQSGLTNPTMTDANGYYAFNNIPAGTYNVIESATDYITSVPAGSIQTTINPASVYNTNEIQVTVENLSSLSFSLHYTGNPYTEQDAAVELNATTYNQSQMSSGKSITSNGDATGQNDVTLSGNPGNVKSFITVCSDLLHGVTVGSQYAVQPELVPDPTYNTSLRTYDGELAYLYNQYAMVTQSGAPGNNTAINGAALQLAIWALEYNPDGSLNIDNANSADGFVVFDSKSSATNPTSQAIINAANSYLTLAANQSEDVYFLSVNQSPGPNKGQGMLSTDLLNFTDTPKASPAVNTVAGGTVIIGSGTKLTDTAVLSGGYNPTGTITFTLTGPGNSVVNTETVSVNGDNTYSTPNGYLPTATGSYVWSATYSGDSNNKSAADNGQNETETVNQTSPSINTVAGGTVIIGSGTKLTDNAVLSGGYQPTGTITFTLTGPGNTVVNTETVSVSGDNTYSTPNGYLPIATGSYVWSATYSGDSNNKSATDNGENESESVITTSDTLSTVAGGTVIIGSGSLLTDTAVLSGAYNPTGTITFTLTGPGNTVVNTETVSVSGDNTYSTPNGYLPSVAGSYVWSATYSGDTNNNSATDNGQNESEAVTQASPGINTVAGGTVIIGSGTKLTDTAVLSGGYNPTGTITFTLTGPGDTVVNTETVTVNGDNTYSTPNGYLPTVTGSYIWSASYSGDTNNNSATDNGQNESESVISGHPTVVTVAGGTVVVGSGALLTDTATLSGGYNPTGTITFTLTGPGNTVVDTETVSVNGDNSYTTPNGYLPTATGTYLWSAYYSGDASNSSAHDNAQNESEAVGPASPSINTVAGATVVLGSGSLLTDTAVLSGGYLPTGTITFILTGPGNTIVNTESVSVNGDNTYSTPNGYLPTATGSYVWSATYSGDTNNNSATDNGQNESASVSPAGPAINTVAGGTAVIGSGTKLTDTATLSGGYNPTGTITFTLTGPGNTVVDTETVTVSGDKNYTTPNGYLPTATGNYVWSATYSGDTNNNGAADNGQNESETVSTASPGISTTQQPASATVGSSIADKATVTGGYNPTGTVTFALYNNSTASGTALFTDTETLSGGTATSKGYTATATGTDYWVATYNGDSNNVSVTSGTASEPVVITGTPNLAVTKTADQSYITAGQTAGFTVTITNNGTVTDTGVTLSDPLPAGAAPT